MRSYEFVVDAEARAFCDDIVQCMLSAFDISEAEALGRVNRQWRRNDFKFQDVRYHETDEFWAHDIYFGHDSFWWNSPSGLEPLPFP
jgi:hypothetical protein